MGAKWGVPNYLDYEVGKPVEVRAGTGRTFVKCELYQGESAMAKNAATVWDSITKQTPAARWYPSVGGAVLTKSVRLDPKTGDKIPVVERVRWNNIALDRCPVNASVPEVSQAPIGVFAKAFGGFVLAKTLTAAGGTDSAGLTGGAALRVQSLDRGVKSYWDFREHLAADLRKGGVGPNPDANAMISHAASQFGLSQDEAAEYVERFMRDLKSGLKRRNAQ